MINRLLINSIVILFLVGCSKISQIDTPSPLPPIQSETIPSTVEVTSTNPIIKSFTPPRTVALSRTPTKTKKPSPSLTLTPSIDFQIKTQCLEIKDQFPAGAKVEGNLVFSMQEDPVKTDIYLQNLQTKHIVRLTPEHNEGYLMDDVSSKGKWLAYELVKHSASEPKKILGRYLIIATANGQTYRIIPWKENWNYINGWRDEEHIMISGIYDLSKLIFRAPLIVYNPFKDESRTYTADFPDIFHGAQILWYGSSDTLAVYDPSFTRVIYPRNGEGWPIVLWDVQNNVQLAQIQGDEDWGSSPRWSPDGSHVVFAKGPSEYQDDLYSLSRDGAIMKLTDLGTIIYRRSIGELSWSQDGQNIAFWLYEKNPPQLVIYNIGLKSATNYCIQGGINGSEPPIWLPNNRQLILSNTWEDGYSHTIFMDIVDGYAVKLGDGMIGYGWMEAIP